MPATLKAEASRGLFLDDEEKTETLCTGSVYSTEDSFVWVKFYVHLLALSILHVSTCVVYYDILFRILICQTMSIAIADEGPLNFQLNRKN